MSSSTSNQQPSSSNATCGYDPNGVSVESYLQKTYDPDPKKRKQVLSELCPCKTMVKILAQTQINKLPIQFSTSPSLYVLLRVLLNRVHRKTLILSGSESSSWPTTNPRWWETRRCTTSATARPGTFKRPLWRPRKGSTTIRIRRWRRRRGGCALRTEPLANGTCCEMKKNNIRKKEHSNFLL